MNKIVELFNNISDTELLEAIQEIKDSSKDGIIKSDGVVRKYAKLSGEITGGATTTDFYLVQMNLMQQASFR